MHSLCLLLIYLYSGIGWTRGPGPGAPSAGTPYCVTNTISTNSVPMPLLCRCVQGCGLVEIVFFLYRMACKLVKSLI